FNVGLSRFRHFALLCKMSDSIRGKLRAGEMRRLLSRSQIALHVPMLIVAFLFMAPLLWMLSTAFKSPEDIINGLGALRWVPRAVTTENFAYGLGKAEEFPVWRWTGNSLLISFAVTALVLVVDSLAAFAYSRL